MSEPDTTSAKKTERDPRMSQKKSLMRVGGLTDAESTGSPLQWRVNISLAM